MNPIHGLIRVQGSTLLGDEKRWRGQSRLGRSRLNDSELAAHLPELGDRKVEVLT